jgi:putative phosphoribosyl transferase
MENAPDERFKQQIIRFRSGTADLEGTLVMPDGATGVVLFAHGSGSGRFSPRNNFVAMVLQESGLGTYLFDLLTEEESADRGKVFDIDLLSERLLDATHWLQRDENLSKLKIGYFGASTGAAAALQAAASEGEKVSAVVSRGGRPDLAAPFLAKVTAPTLLIVGGNDLQVIALNREAFQLIKGEKRLEIVPGATHLFEERGALEQVAALARDWFKRYLA